MKDWIGILDSGVGGIGVLKAAVDLMPNENYIYYGDNANAPYGPRSIDDIRMLSAQAVERLTNFGVKAIVIACNTITAAYAADLRSKATIPIIGMEPAVKPASFARSDGSVLALATKATLSLEKFARLMTEYGEGVIPLEGVGLVELVERGIADSEEAHARLHSLFAPYQNQKIDAIVLGCTHYPFLRRQIESFFPDAQIFDGREGTVQQLKRRLQAEGLLTDRSERGEIRFETSGDDSVRALMRRLYESDL